MKMRGTRRRFTWFVPLTARTEEDHPGRTNIQSVPQPLYYFGCLLIRSLCQTSHRGELLLKLMGCDVIIYDVTQQAEQVGEALWAVSGEASFTLLTLFVNTVCLH